MLKFIKASIPSSIWNQHDLNKNILSTKAMGEVLWFERFSPEASRKGKNIEHLSLQFYLFFADALSSTVAVQWKILKDRFAHSTGCFLRERNDSRSWDCDVVGF